MNKNITIEKKVLSENDRLAAAIRQWLKANKTTALNFVSSPGSGKTTLLERTLRKFDGHPKTAVVAGDVQTDNDAARLIRAGGTLVRPIMTGGACHLDARMVTKALDELDMTDVRLLFIENVGNLVCPSSYDLGEDMKVVLISTTEGDDKPLKYPSMFHRSSVLVINKTDLLGLSDFSLDRVVKNALKINPNLRVFAVSCATGEGLPAWYDWLNELAADSP